MSGEEEIAKGGKDYSENFQQDEISLMPVTPHHFLFCAAEFLSADDFPKTGFRSRFQEYAVPPYSLDDSRTTGTCTDTIEISALCMYETPLSRRGVSMNQINQINKINQMDQTETVRAPKPLEDGGANRYEMWCRLPPGSRL